MADELKDPNSLDSTEMAALIRGEIADPREPSRPTVETKATTEPEVVMTDEEPKKEPSGDRSPEPSVDEGTSRQGDDDRQKLLSTIERLERQNAEFAQLKEQFEKERSSRDEPRVEMTEYFPGITLPKDPNKLPIRLTPDQLKSVGIDADETLAKGLSVLGSALLVRMDAAMRPYIDERYNTLSSVRENASRGTTAFFDAYPDLAGQDDFIALVEQGARERDKIHQIYSGEAYTRELAKRVRTRIASMRGQSLQDYENALGGQSSRQPVSRATVTPPRRSAAAPRRTGEQSEIDAVMDGRL